MAKFSLQGRVALITGSSKGLGAGIARTLAASGATIVVNAFNNVAQAQTIADEITAGGGTAIAIGADVSNASDIRRLVAESEATLGAPIDILVPNATPPQPQMPIEDYDEAFYRQMLDFFVISPFLLAQAVLPSMKARKWGRIVNITSEVFAVSHPDFSAYVAAKGGQIGWSRGMATELAPHGITVNMVAPGWIPVERHADDPQEAKDGYLATIPIARWGTPEDVGNAVAFFASQEASFITGQSLHVNGGRSPW
ncbi:MAG: 3-oxoacyl-ACP reductase FabG [Verrucomicrobia bacterium]|nr:3-oxoacyl-ACP reductase FabG [Verrucomicrobiota bacterium]